MKKQFSKVLLLSSLLLLTSCNYRAKALYDYSLDNVENPDNVNFKKTINFRVSFEDNQDISNPFIFEDSIIKIQWFPTIHNFGFKLVNKTNSTLKVIWDSGAIIDNTGASYRIMNKLTKLSEEDKSAVPTPVAKKTFIEDLVYPVGWSTYRPGFFVSKLYVPSRWISPPLLPTYSGESNDEEHGKKLDKLKEEFLNKSFKILLPIEYNNKVREYIFSFKIENIQMKKVD